MPLWSTRQGNRTEEKWMGWTWIAFGVAFATPLIGFAWFSK
ncbi:MAG: hypothetical protein ABWY57_10765 [Mycetocola sp.]